MLDQLGHTARQEQTVTAKGIQGHTRAHKGTRGSRCTRDGPPTRMKQLNTGVGDWLTAHLANEVASGFASGSSCRLMAGR